MPIKHTKFPHTGIFQTSTREVEIREDEESFRDLAELRSGGNEDDSLGLDAMEVAARDYIKGYARAQRFDETLLRPESIEWLEWPLREETEQIASKLRQGDLSREQERRLIRMLAEAQRAIEACEILARVSGIRFRLQNEPSSRNAIGEGLMLGQAWTRFRARPYEPNAWTGGRIRAGLSETGTARKGTTTINYKKIAEDFHRSGLSQRCFAKARGYSRTTVQRALRQNF